MVFEARKLRKVLSGSDQFVTAPILAERTWMPDRARCASNYFAPTKKQTDNECHAIDYWYCCSKFALEDKYESAELKSLMQWALYRHTLLGPPAEKNNWHRLYHVFFLESRLRRLWIWVNQVLLFQTRYSQKYSCVHFFAFLGKVQMLYTLYFLFLDSFSRSFLFCQLDLFSVFPPIYFPEKRNKLLLLE